MEDIIGALETCGIRDGRDGDVKESALKPSEAKERYLRLEDKFTNLNLQFFPFFLTFRLFCLLELGNSNRLFESTDTTAHDTRHLAQPRSQLCSRLRPSDSQMSSSYMPQSSQDAVQNDSHTVYTIYIYIIYTFIIYIYHMHCEFQKNPQRQHTSSTFSAKP